MRFKKFEKPHKNAKFQAKRAVMKQDETVKTQTRTKKTVGIRGNVMTVGCSSPREPVPV